MLYAVLKLFCTEEEREYWRDRFTSGGLGYREVKEAIFDLYMRRFEPVRARRRELESQPEYIAEVLRRGAERARRVAAPLLREVRAAMGIPNR